uniref:Cingulin b n=1 Tax=Myripristis murdjan TaxID=586833 RepID=A0A668A2Q8_9TELE
MSTLSSDKKPLVDYGVQIRFIKDLHDSGGGYSEKSRAGNSATPPSNKYGVAVRVQGISGQPYVVLQDGEKGDSYGVQLKTQAQSQNASPGPSSPYNSLTKENKSAEFTSSYTAAPNVAVSPASLAEDEDVEIFGSPLKRPPGDGQAGSQGEGEGGAGSREAQSETAKAETQPKATTSGAEKEKRERTNREEFNEAGLKPVKLNGVGPRGVSQNGIGFTGSLGRYSGKQMSMDSPLESFPEPPTEDEAAPAIDTNSLAPINKLISKFNSGTPASATQTRGRSGARQRLRFDERRRSRSLDARKDVQHEAPPRSPTSPTLNPYATPLSPVSTSSNLLTSSSPASGSLGRSPASVAKVTALAAPKPSFKLAELRMAREGAESRVRQQEDQLAELQEELRRLSESSPHTDSLLYSSSMNTHRDIMSTQRCTHNRCISPSIHQSADVCFSCLQDVMALQADLAEAAMLRQRMEDTLHQRERELTALKGALKEEVECHDREMEALREQYSQDMENLRRTMEQVSQVRQAGGIPYPAVCLKEQYSGFLSLQSRLHSSLPLSSEAEEAVEALEDENRSLKSQLEEAKRGATRLSKERDELNRRLEEKDLEREALRRGKSDLEEQKRLLDRALEKINKEMEMMMGDSRQSVAALQTQLDEYRERSRKDLLDAQRNSKDRLAELQRAQSNLKAQQEEVSRLKKELLACVEERDSAQLERDLLSSRLKHLESELEEEKSAHTDRSREIRGLEDKIKTLEIELDEERSSVELQNDRITRSRDQIDQLRSDLMQERSARHDLEMDKSSLERQVKELKSRVADMEGQTRPTAGITLLENKIQELEERLRSEEREKASIQASQRRMERKLKELNATLDQERNQHAEQRDQLSLRVKALKRQVDESEGEVERLEGVRRKVLRDLEEQQELQEALQAKVTALEAELKRKVQQTHRSALGSSNFSSEDEDGFYDNNNITCILTESHLQTTNC